MEQVLVFIGNNPILTGAFAVVLAALIATEFGRMTRRWKEIETHEAIQLINRQDPLILDVSNSADHAAAHILNAQSMPPSRIEAGNQTLMKAKDRPILMYCKNNQVAPQMATRLAKLGFEQVHVLKGGLTQWRADNQPVTRGKARKKNKDSKDKDKRAKND
jgi:rhodanese-related sulfurtransferase